MTAQDVRPFFTPITMSAEEWEDLRTQRRLLNAERAKLLTECLAQAARADRLQGENDAAWFDIEHGWDIEPRSYFEEAPKHGFATALGHALHNIWKREVKADPEVKRLQGVIDGHRAWLTHCKAVADEIGYVSSVSSTLRDVIENLNQMIDLDAHLQGAKHDGE